MTHAAEGKLSTLENKEEIVSVSSCTFYFCIETEEIIAIEDAKLASEIESDIDELSNAMNNVALAKYKCDGLIDSYINELNKNISEEVELGSLSIKIDEAESELEQYQYQLLNSLDKLEQDSSDENSKLIFKDSAVKYSSMIELIPLNERKNKESVESRKKLDRKYVYASRKKILIDSTGKVKKVKLKGADKKTGQASIYKKDSKGNYKLDTKLLKEQLTELKKDVKLWGFNKELVDEKLVEWGETWKYGENVDVSAQAQFLRFTSNVGASADWSGGHLTASGSLSTVANIADGAIKASRYYPDRVGFVLQYILDDQKGAGLGNEINMGCIRANLSFDLTGSIGGSILISGSLDVELTEAKEGKASINARGSNQKGNARFSERQAKGRKFSNSNTANKNKYDSSKSKNNVNGSANAFVGAQAGAKVSGGLEWLRPVDYHETMGSNPVAKVIHDSDFKQGKYVEFCTVAIGIDAMAGAGFGGEFSIGFSKESLLIHMGASLCVGLGAKGSFLFNVGFDKISEFISWFVYQLYSVDYRKLGYITSDAFKVITKLMVIRFLGYDVRGSIDGIESFPEYIEGIYEEYILPAIYEAEESEARDVMALRINENKENIFYLNPEAKAVLIFLLTRTSVIDYASSVSISNFDVYLNRKKAVINILQSIQTKNEWMNIMSRFNADADEIKYKEEPDKVVERSEREIIDFLQLGRDSDREFYKYKNGLIMKEFDFSNYYNFNANMSTIFYAIKSRLKLRPALGYALTMNYQPAYHLNVTDNPSYNRMCDYGTSFCVVEKVV